MDADALSPYSARVGLVALRGSLTVASSHKLAGVIGADIKDHDVVIFDFSGANYLDDSAAMVIGQLMDIAKGEQTECIVMGLSGLVPRTLNALGILRHLPRQREGSSASDTGPAVQPSRPDLEDVKSPPRQLPHSENRRNIEKEISICPCVHAKCAYIQYYCQIAQRSRTLSAGCSIFRLWNSVYIRNVSTSQGPIRTGGFLALAVCRFLALFRR